MQVARPNNKLRRTDRLLQAYSMSNYNKTGSEWSSSHISGDSEFYYIYIYIYMYVCKVIN